MNYSLSTVESSQSGFIRQSFLDNELEHGLRKVENLTKDLTDEVNHALRRISDIMSVPTIRDDEFIYKVRQAMKHKDNTIERLQQFDQRQTYTLHTIDQDFTKLKNCVHDIQAMFKSKQIKITTFKANQLLDIEPYRDIRARLEYEEAVHLIKEKLIDLYHKAIDTNYAELLLEAFHEVFPGFSSKAKVSSTIEKNDLSHLPKDVADKYKDSPELTEEQTKNLQNYLKGIQSGEIEGNMDEDFHVNSDDYAFEHNIFGRPLGGGKPEFDEKVVAGSEFVFDFFLGDVNTVLDSEASLQDRILAGISIVPAGKVLKLADKIKDLDKVADVKKGTKGTVKATPNFGQKMEYVFGNATGNKHNIDRSIAMERQLNSIGIFDNSKGRELVLDNLTDTFHDGSSILKTQENGRVVRESILTGPQGVLKVESVWDGEKLITVKLFGGK